MRLQKLYSYTRKAIELYDMIQDGDKIAIGISGGKDSLTLLYALSGLRTFYPKHFDIEGIAVDLGFENFDLSGVEKLCKNLDVPFTVVKTQIGDIVFSHSKENPCSLCAKMRKGALNQKALELGCNKAAYAHHKDDFIETMLMSLLFQGQFYAFPPVTPLDQTGLTVIRPLMLVEEKDVKGFSNKYKLPISKNPCPKDGYTKREYAKNLVAQLNFENPGAKDRLFHSIIYGNIGDWPQRCE